MHAVERIITYNLTRSSSGPDTCIWITKIYLLVPPLRLIRRKKFLEKLNWRNGHRELSKVETQRPQSSFQTFFDTQTSKTFTWLWAEILYWLLCSSFVRQRGSEVILVNDISRYPMISYASLYKLNVLLTLINQSIKYDYFTLGENMWTSK